MRGGSVLESFSMVNTIVFDKTGTLTIGRPTVTEVVPQGHNDETNAKLVKSIMKKIFKVLELSSLLKMEVIPVWITHYAFKR